jgi:hypothetical protein
MNRVTLGVLTAAKTPSPMMAKKIHSIQERSQKRISNHAMRQNIPAPNSIP